MLQELLQRFETNQVFTDSEAWLLFRMAAIGEACGWTLLILGIWCERFILPHSTIPVFLAGRVHGMLFLIYALAAIGLYPSLRWSRRRALVATLASVPPYGSLLFEQWASYQRRHSQLKIYSQSLLWLLLTQELAQP